MKSGLNTIYMSGGHNHYVREGGESGAGLSQRARDWVDEQNLIQHDQVKPARYIELAIAAGILPKVSNREFRKKALQLRNYVTRHRAVANLNGHLAAGSYAALAEKVSALSIGDGSMSSLQQ